MENKKMQPSLRALILLGYLYSLDTAEFSPSAASQQNPLALPSRRVAQATIEELAAIGWVSYTVGTSRHNRSSFTLLEPALLFLAENGVPVIFTAPFGTVKPHFTARNGTVKPPFTARNGTVKPPFTARNGTVKPPFTARNGTVNPCPPPIFWPKNDFFSSTPYSLDKTVSTTSTLVELNPSTQSGKRGVGKKPKTQNQKLQLDFSRLADLPTEIAQAFQDFVASRAELKKPIRTQKALNQNLNLVFWALKACGKEATLAAINLVTRSQWQGLKEVYFEDAKKTALERFNLAEWYKVSPEPLGGQETRFLCEIRAKVDEMTERKSKENGKEADFDLKGRAFTLFLAMLQKTKFRGTSTRELNEKFADVYAAVQAAFLNNKKV